MKRRTAKLLIILLYALTLAGAAITMNLWGNKSLMWTFAGIMIATSLILGRYLRCPACGRGQGRAWLWATHCPHCGASLEE